MLRARRVVSEEPCPRESLVMCHGSNTNDWLSMISTTLLLLTSCEFSGRTLSIHNNTQKVRKKQCEHMHGSQSSTNRMQTRMWSPDCGVGPLIPPAAAPDTGPAVRAEENMLRPCIPPAAPLPVVEERGALDEKNMFAQLLRLHTRTRTRVGGCGTKCSVHTRRQSKEQERERKKKKETQEIRSLIHI